MEINNGIDTNTMTRLYESLLQTFSRIHYIPKHCCMEYFPLQSIQAELFDK